MNNKLLRIFFLTSLFWSATAIAEFKYMYIGTPLNPIAGHLGGQSLNFEFTTPNLLPANLTLDYAGLITPTYSVSFC